MVQFVLPHSVDSVFKDNYGVSLHHTVREQLYDRKYGMSAVMRHTDMKNIRLN